MTVNHCSYDAPLAIQRALGAITPAFALFREVKKGNPVDMSIPTGPSEFSANCLVAHGMTECLAIELISKPSNLNSSSEFICVHQGVYRLVCQRSQRTIDDPQYESAFSAIVEAQLGLAICIFENEIALKRHKRELDLITHALDSLPQSVFILDHDRRYIFQNQNDRDAFVDLRGKQIEDGGLDASMTAEWVGLHNDILAGNSYDSETQKLSKGQTFTSRTMLEPVFNQDHICGIVGLSLDCSVEAAALARLCENEERLQSWLKLSSDWVWETDDAYRLTLIEGDSVSHGIDFASWHGRKSWEVIGASAEGDQLLAEFKHLFEAQESIRNVCFEMMRNDGKPITVEIEAEPSLDSNGSFLGYRGVSRNVTGREEMLKRLRRAELISNETQHAIVITDAKGRITWVNAAFTTVTGYKLEEVAGYTPGSILQCSATDPETVAEIRTALGKGEGIRKTILNRAKCGREYWLDLEIRSIHDSEGRLDGFIAIENDVTTLINDQNRKNAIFENMTAGIVIHDETGATIDCNVEAARILGVTKDQLLGRTAMDQAWQLVDLDGKPLAEKEVPAIRALRENRVIKNQIIGVRHGTGEARWLRASAQVFSSGGDKMQALVSFADVTEEENARRDAEKARELMSSIIETMPDAVAAYDQEDRLLLCNAAYKSIYSTSAPAIYKGATFESILRYGLERGQYRDAGQSHAEQEAWLADRLRRHRKPKPETMLQRLDDGRWLQVRERVSPSGAIVGVRTDVTALKVAEQRVRRAAEQDDLTGLANRSAFIYRFEKSLNGARHDDGSGLVALIDLDHFKDLNDTLGHDIGDNYLKEISQRLVQSTRAGDLVARLGGDEFALLMPGITNREVAIKTIQALVETVNQPLWIGGRMIHPKMSIGVSVYPEDGTQVTELLKNADIAMYTTKKSGRNNITMFDPAQKQYLVRRTFLSERLREALRDNKLDVAFQAQVDLQTGHHLGFEALARWNSSGEYISPAEFIPISEEFGLSSEIDLLVLGKSLARIKYLKSQGHTPGTVAVNIGTVLLRDETFPARVASLLSASGLTPHDLEVEVTEGVMIERGNEKIRASLAALRQLGVSIALDDFGTGYASLSHLKQFQIDKLKIDKSFVDDISIDRSNEMIAKTIINLARSLEIKVVAEGIETSTQKLFLSNHGCHIGQGYLFHKPETGEEEIEAYLKGAPKSKLNQAKYYRGVRVL